MIKRNKLGRFVKGEHPHIKTEIKKGQHLSKKTEFKKIYSNEELRNKRLEYGRKWRKKNKEKTRVEYLTRKIKIPKNEKCKICKKNLAKIKHHEDYSKPLKVDFLCYSCHNKKIKNRSKKHIKIHLKRLTESKI